MKDYKIIMWDLDGTLSDPKEGITKSVQYALSKLRIIEEDEEKLMEFIGPPLQETFSRFYNFDQETTRAAIEFYRERYKEKGMFENYLYPGIPELLGRLKSRNVILVVATSKPTVFSEKILGHFNISGLFDTIVGSNLDGTMSAKAEIIGYIMNRYSDFEPKDFLMIGDRKHDIIGARHNGIDSVGVGYGYGSRKELEESGPTYIANTLQELEILLGE